MAIGQFNPGPSTANHQCSLVAHRHGCQLSSSPVLAFPFIDKQRAARNKSQNNSKNKCRDNHGFIESRKYSDVGQEIKKYA